MKNRIKLKIELKKNFKLLTRREKLYIYDLICDFHGEQCMICGKERVNRRLHIDHCHKTNKIRGLLCHWCNRGLVWFKDNPELLRNAANYLEEVK